MALAGLLLPLFALSLQATDRFVSLAGGNNPPYASWADAATNIQDAVDAAATGDVVWVTNGVYASGGKFVIPTQTNRVLILKAITVQSVNGPFVTTIQGLGLPVYRNMRCAWLTNGAVLRGFTLEQGAMSSVGGGVYCYSANAIVANCVIRSNTASSGGGGVYQGTVLNCAIFGNTSQSSGGGAYSGVLRDCTVSSNFVTSSSSQNGGGIYGGAATNCVIYNNLHVNTSVREIDNYASATLSYCCSTPLPSAAGNISAPPQLLSDNMHLASSSPCWGAGTNIASGTDIDGQPWSNPPPIGCDEAQATPMLTAPPVIQLTSDPVGFTVGVLSTGQEPLTCWWTRDGVPLENDGHYTNAHTTTLAAIGGGPQDAGAYQVVVSNAFGMVTSALAQVVVHCVDQAGAAPAPPYLSWATAATNIQDAIDAAADGEIVMVTNGVYAFGGRAMGDGLTNRVVLDKALLVESINGIASTMIQGAWDPATNGPLAVRCSWLTNGATLSGFTITGGATRANTSSGGTSQYGGGVYTASYTVSNAIVAKCLIVGNVAGTSGGGASGGILLNCTLTGNCVVGNPAWGGCSGGGAAGSSLRNCIIKGNFASGNGGGTSGGTLRNCAVIGNTTPGNGGGSYNGTLINCTISGNSGTSSGSWGGGVYSGNLTNCIVYANRIASSIYPNYTNYYTLAQLSFCCATPLPPGVGNISLDPQLLADGFHLLPTSPCRGAGTNRVVVGIDIDGQPWANPPAIGCDEWQPAPTIFAQPVIQFTNSPFGFSVNAVAGGQDLVCWWTRDGVLLEDDGHYASTHTTTLVAKGLLPQDVGTYQVVVSNALGSVTSSVVQLQMTFHYANIAGTNPVPPYADWATAATNIQDAIDIAAPGEIVLVADGRYATGGKVMAGDLTNRVALTKSVTVTSVNGRATTIIQGSPGPYLLTGSNAVRCAWLTNGATLNGFTLRYGGTRTNGDNVALQSGGGVWAAWTDASIINCVITNNAANYYGGGCYQGTLVQCVVAQNQTWWRGGGAYQATLRNCLIQGNFSEFYGGGTAYGSVFNCLVTGNSCPGSNRGSGTYQTSARNCIIYNNAFDNWVFDPVPDIAFTCTSPKPSGTGNINADPQLLDSMHLSVTSPCRGAGSAAYTAGVDVDNELWANPPSMGCDEIWDSALAGPLSVAITTSWTTAVEQRTFYLEGHITGHASRVAWSFGDGSIITNGSAATGSHTWTNTGDYTVTFTAFNNDNPGGVSTNLTVHVVPIVQPILSLDGFSGNTLSLSFTAQGGVTSYVEKTTNLSPPLVWHTVWSSFSVEGQVQVSDTVDTNGSAFYRIRTQ
jgi:hypothetical protein